MPSSFSSTTTFKNSLKLSIKIALLLLFTLGNMGEILAILFKDLKLPLQLGPYIIGARIIVTLKSVESKANNASSAFALDCP